MGVGLETIFDLADNDENVSLTDLEKWKMFLDKMEIKYKESVDCITIDDTHLREDVYGAEVALVFDNGKFRYFHPSGE